MINDYRLVRLENLVYLLVKILLAIELVLFIVFRVFYKNHMGGQILEMMFSLLKIGAFTPLFFCPRCILVVYRILENTYKSFGGKILLSTIGAMTLAVSFCFANQFVNYVTHENPTYFSSVVSLCASAIVVLIWFFGLPLLVYTYSITVGMIKSLWLDKRDDESKQKNKYSMYFFIGSLGWIYIVMYLSDMTRFIPDYIYEKPLVFFGYYHSSQCKNVSETDKMAFLDGDHISVVKFDAINKNYIFTDSVCVKTI